MKLNYKRTILIGLAFMSISVFWQVYDTMVPLVLKQSFHMGDTVSGIIMAMDNILALFLLPIFGNLSDKTNTLLGKRTPFIIVGTALAVIFMLMLPIADRMLNLTFFIVALFLTLISMGTYRSPAVALMPNLTPKPLRSKANAIINLMGAVGGIISLLMIKFLVPAGERPDYFPLFLGAAIVMVVCVVVMVLTVPEKKLAAAIGVENEDEPTDTTAESAGKMPKDVFRSLILILCAVSLWFMAYNAVTSAFSKYTQVYLGMEGTGFADCLLIATVAAIITYIPAGTLASKIGRRKTILLGICLMITSFACAMLFTSWSPVLIILFALTGMGWASINVNSYPMVVEMSRGSNIGKYTGYYYTFSMSAQVLTPILSGALLEHVGYWTLFPYAVLFMVLALCVMFFVRHGDSKPTTPKSKLEMLDVDD
ncbi:MAG: MFS transporter [Firmicutes bacterium]|nr:MFS transporter [Bacillota bacterium]